VEIPLLLTPTDLLVALFSMAPMLVLGVPALLRMRQPAQLDYEPIADEALPAGLRRWLDGLEPRFAALGYRAAGTWRVTNLPNQVAVTRVWLSDSEPAVGCAAAMLTTGDRPQVGQSYLEFATEFADGTMVNTASLRRSRFRRRYHTVAKAHDAPGLRDPARLKALHERNCARFLHRGPRLLRADELVPAMADFSRRDVEHRRRVGLWRSHPDGEGPTLRGAVLLTLDFLAPFSVELGPARILGALTLGLFLPFLTEGPLVDAGLLPAGLGHAAALVGAIGLGALAGVRGLFWGPLVLHTGLRLAGAEAGNAFLFAFSTQAAAIGASNLASRLRARL
jgi:hypothetical protein